MAHAGGNEEWRKNADTHKMSSETAKRVTGHPGGGAGAEILHQRRSLPYSYTTMALAGLAVVGGLWYFTFYVKKKPEATAADVAKVSVGSAQAEDTRPRK